MTWYQPFMIAVALVWLFATERDRPAARIILIATLVSFCLTTFVTCHITAAWKLVIPGMVETLTILSLCRWARNRTGLLQAVCLIPAWLAHPLCYLDVRLHTDIVYSHYVAILGLVAILQVIAFHDTLLSIARRLAAWLGSLGADRAHPVSDAGVCHPVLRDSGVHRV